MNKYSIKLLKVIRIGYKRLFGSKIDKKPLCDNNPDTTSLNIYNNLMSEQPCMIARFGSTEMNCLCNYIGIKDQKGQYINYIKGRTNPWWWEPQVINQLQLWSGFFPAKVDKIELFCELMLQDIPEVDILGSWLEQEHIFAEELNRTYKINFELLNPYFSQIPWTKALEGKKVLVVHPFAETIETQYQKRDFLFKNNLLPTFHLKTIKAIQSVAGEKTGFADWFEALEYMKAEINKKDYDICLIAAGAYGFSLAAHVKRMGKKGFHMGGSLQLLFGIKGKRWENENYNQIYNYSRLMNEHWVKPGDGEKPTNAQSVENACYW